MMADHFDNPARLRGFMLREFGAPWTGALELLFQRCAFKRVGDSLERDQFRRGTLEATA